MRMVVTGREGQIVRSLAERAPGTGIEIIALGRPQLDLAGPSGEIVAAIIGTRPDIIVSAAAYTLVDKAETDSELAFAVNEKGSKAVAGAARETGVPLIHLSTDYVFDGLKPTPYVEEDPTRPNGIYGASKLAGEQAVLAEHANTVVLRTAWVYSPFGANFAKTMLRLAETRDALGVVEDQIGCPTSALDIADAVLAVVDAWRTEPRRGADAIYHFAGTGEASWADFARAIFAESARRGGPVADVKDIPTSAWPTKARRPANSRLDCGKFARTFYAPPSWEDSLRVVMARLSV